VKEDAAYAAAASAGPGRSGAMDVEAMSQPSPAVESPENVPPATEPSRAYGESELAAAWANWKQIRESVVGSQLVESQVVESQVSESQVSESQLSEPQISSPIADPVAELKENSSAAQPESQPEAAPVTGEESSEIANIVDSVLADLKPKLMAEIARKMGKEKKK